MGTTIALTYTGALAFKRAGARPRQWSVTVRLPPGGSATAEVPIPQQEVWIATHEIVDCESGAVRHRCWKDGELVVDLIHDETNMRIDYPMGLFIETNYKGELENLTTREIEFALTLFYEMIPKRYHERIERKEVRK